MNSNLYKYTLRDPYFSNKENMWIITRYKDVKQLIHGESLSNNLFVEKITDYTENNLSPIEKIKMLWLNTFDLPEHSIPRRAFDDLFSKKQINLYKDAINDLASQTASSLATLKEFDLIKRYAIPLPIKIIMHIFDIDNDDYSIIKSLLNDFTLFTSNSPSDPTLERANKAADTLYHYFKKLIGERANQSDDVIGKLLNNENIIQSLTRDQIIANLVMLLWGGQITTTHLTGLWIYTLLKNQDQLHLLLDDSQYYNCMVEELLRFTSPTQMIMRKAKEDLEISGNTIAKNDYVRLVLYTANRDPEKFQNPNDFNVRREPNQHLAFGSGTHFCIGANLARFTLPTIIRNILSTFPLMSMPTQNISYHKSSVLPGIDKLIIHTK